jgi:hypothetical protein
MAPEQPNNPPSANTFTSIESVIQEPEEELNPSLNGVSPNQPRNLFGNRQLPSLPLYLTHFVARSTNSVNLDEVREEMEDTGLADDDDSVEEAVEASLLTDSLVECFQDRVDDDSVFFSDANGIRDVKLNVNVPALPEDFTPPPVKSRKGEPLFQVR